MVSKSIDVLQSRTVTSGAPMSSDVVPMSGCRVVSHLRAVSGLQGI